MVADAGWLKEYVRDVPDFPRPGVVFKDITPLLADSRAFRFVIEVAFLEGRSLVEPHDAMSLITYG